MNQEVHLDSFTVFSLTKQNKKTSPLPPTNWLKYNFSPLKHCLVPYPYRSTLKDQAHKIRLQTMAQRKRLKPPAAAGNPCCTNTSVMGLLLALQVIVGSSNLFPAHIRDELQHPPWKALPLASPSLSTAHPHTEGEQKELEHWLHMKPQSKNKPFTVQV